MDSLLLRLAGIPESSSLADTLRERQRILQLTAASRRAVLQPQEPGGLSTTLRAALATRIARLNESAELAEHYRAVLDRDAHAEPALVRLCDPSITPTGDDPWLAAVVRHAGLLTTQPQEVTRDDINRLRAGGVDDGDTVRLTQLAGFLSYEIRLLAGLKLLNEIGAH